MSACALILVGCTSTPPGPVKQALPPTPTAKQPLPPATAAKKGGYYLDDGPEAVPPPNLDEVKDAVPRIEPPHRYANRTYDAMGSTYTPDTSVSGYQKEGVASWYGKRFHGKKTASGERYDMYAMTAAHRTLPIPSYARVTSLTTGKSVVVRINDRGPFSKNRLIDLSYVAAHKLDYLGAGSTRVRVESIDPAQLDEADAPLSSGIYLQLGAFSNQEKAQKLREKVQVNIESPAPPVQVVQIGKFHRVTLGPYATDEAADVDGARLQQNLGMKAIKLAR